MGLEVATYVNQLVPSNPLGTDDRSQGDDHIRLIKSVLKNTFPNIDGPVTLTEEQINGVAGDGKLNQPGFIVMWSGTIASIPVGWKLCDGTGTISNGNPVPNLVDRFIIGSKTESGGTFNIGATGGSKDQVVAGTSEGTALTIAQMPAHAHKTGSAFQGPGINGGASGGVGLTTTTDTIGGGQAHTHAINITTVNGNLPPYFALAFLIKD